jgi:hypothetical protein
MSAKKVVWTIIAIAAAVALSLPLRSHHLRVLSVSRSISIEGAVIQRDIDTKKELPIANVTVTASDGAVTASARSDASGYFKLTLQRSLLSGQPIDVSLSHPDYEPYFFQVQTGRLQTPQQLYVAAMSPLPATVTTRQEAVVSNLRVRYTINSRTEANVGSAVKTFQVISQGSSPCDKHQPCSPDKKWKAATGSASLDAGPDNVFGNIRASCIAGPCPFTRIDTSGFIHGGRKITVSALDWSDTATFLLEAEVFRAEISSNVRESYPVIFGRTLSFTLPPTQEGVSLEGEINGAAMVFPLGPDLYLSWAICNARPGSEKDNATTYSCELRPGYRF